MSMALKASRAAVGAPSGGAFISRSQFMGDPGLFGFIGKAISKVGSFVGQSLPGPVGTLARSFFPTQQQRPPILVAPPRAPFVGPTFFPQNVPQQAPNGRGGTPAGQPTAGGGAARFFPGGETGIGEGCANGFHPNKTAYHLKDGSFVDVGTRCVKNRRRNPLNPRAASRAISRIESAKRATSALDRVTVRCRRCGKARCECRR